MLLIVFRLKIVAIEDFLKCTVIGKMLRFAIRLYTCLPPLVYAVSLSFGLQVRISFTRAGLLVTSQVEHVSSRIQFSGMLNHFPVHTKCTRALKQNPRALYMDTGCDSDLKTGIRNK